MKSIFEEMGGTYSDISGYLIPNLAMPELPPLGKYGRMLKRCLKEHRPALYSSMLLRSTKPARSAWNCLPDRWQSKRA